MRTHYAIVRSSNRPVPVEVCGPIFWVIRPRSIGPYPAVAGPFRRANPRFQLMPRDWRPDDA